MVNDKSVPDYTRIREEIFNQSKIKSTKWSKFRHNFVKNRVNFSNIKEKRVYFETLSVSSVKRSLYRIYKRVFKSRHSGYEHFVADEEKRYIGGWMSIPQGLSNCPRGLEYLSMIDQLLVHQKVELLEAFVGFETNNKYIVKNSVGQNVYCAVEDNDCCTRNCCGPMRPFDMKVMDNFRNEVIHIHRPLACDSCWCPCWLQSMEVSAPPGTVIGSIEQEWSICKPCYAIKNAVGDVVLRIKGPVCTYSICGDVEFHVYSSDGETEVGKITKQWSGLAREVFTDADYFGISFPLDLDVKIKAVLLGACFLIDFMFFEKAGNKENDRPGML